MKKQKVLLAEDDPLDADLTIQALKSIPIGNEIVHFNDGLELLNYLNQEEKEDVLAEEVSLIITDLKMPRVDGLKALEAIRNNTKFDKIPVVIFSSSSQPIDVDTCYHNRSNAYVVKPSNIDDFLEAVKSMGLFWTTWNHTN